MSYRRARRGAIALAVLSLHAGPAAGDPARDSEPISSDQAHAPSRPSPADDRATVPASSSTEPAVETLCRAAVALALAEPERAQSFITRARLAGWLPELRFRLFRRFARTEGLTLDDTVTSAPVDVSAVDDVRYEWRATWDLSRIVFNPEELQAHAEGLRMSDVRRDIQSLVVRLYFERRRLLIALKGTEGGSMTGGDAEERRRLRVAELEAQLEALTGRDFFRPTGGTAAETHP